MIWHSTECLYLVAAPEVGYPETRDGGNNPSFNPPKKTSKRNNLKFSFWRFLFISTGTIFSRICLGNRIKNIGTPYNTSMEWLYITLIISLVFWLFNARRWSSTSQPHSLLNVDVFAVTVGLGIYIFCRIIILFNTKYYQKIPDGIFRIPIIMNNARENNTGSTPTKELILHSIALDTTFKWSTLWQPQLYNF